MTKTRRAILATALTALAILAGPAGAQSPGQQAKAAFFAIEADPFNTPTYRNARDEIGRAYKAAPNDAWVLIAVSRVYLEDGYIKGDRASLGSYAADAVRLANQYARQAAEAGPQEPMAHVQLARLQIITEDHRGAWETLNRAYLLDPKSFYPWYHRGVVSYKMKDYKRAAEAFDAAHERAAFSWQKEWAIDKRGDIAYRQGDTATEERIYKQLIEMSPRSPHAHGNYGNFLKRQKRYDEAIVYYGKAIAIRSYPQAEENLKKTLLLRDAARK